MKTNIKNLISENPSGLLEMKSPLSISEYRDQYGFGLKNVFTIYQSKKSHHSEKDWFAFPNKTLETLFTVQEQSEGNLLVVYIAEVIKGNKVYCYLILNDNAFKDLMKNSCILQVHQMYSQFWEDHVALNMDDKQDDADTELFNTSDTPTAEHISSYQCCGYSHSEAFSAALRENQRFTDRLNKRLEM